MKDSGIPIELTSSVGLKSKKDIARGKYREWSCYTKEAGIYKAILFVLARGKCPRCGRDMFFSYNRKWNNNRHAVTLDHTIPLAVTLKHSKFGLQILCKECNNGIKSVEDEALKNSKTQP